MLGKLLKYELKSTAKFFVPMYFAIVLITTLNSIFMRKNIFVKVQSFITIVIGALFVAMITLTIVIIIKRFKKNLLGDEGYLMFTLPVSSGKLILSKYISALIWVFFTIIVTMISVIIYINGALTENGGLFEGFHINGITIQVTEFVKGIIIIAGAIVLILSALSILIFIIYNSLAIAQIPIFYKYKTVVSIISFFIIGKFVNVIYNIINRVGINPNISDVEFLQSFIKLTSIGILENIIVVIVLFISLNYTLSKKLNLD